MKTRHLVLAMLLAFSVNAASAAQEKAGKDAAVRYAEDKKLCAEETSSSARMQCLRDAKAEYDKSGGASVCAECGKVLSVRVVERKGESSAVGMIAGGVAGAVLGNQVGSGRGRDVATVAGAAGGAYAGHKIEEKVKSTKSWVVSVRFDDGTDRNFSFSADPGYAAGDPVKQSGKSIVRR